MSIRVALNVACVLNQTLMSLAALNVAWADSLEPDVRCRPGGVKGRLIKMLHVV